MPVVLMIRMMALQVLETEAVALVTRAVAIRMEVMTKVVVARQAAILAVVMTNNFSQSVLPTSFSHGFHFRLH
jgi:hypothetical protein